MLEFKVSIKLMILKLIQMYNKELKKNIKINGVLNIKDLRFLNVWVTILIVTVVSIFTDNLKILLAIKMKKFIKKMIVFCKILIVKMILILKNKKIKKI